MNMIKFILYIIMYLQILFLSHSLFFCQGLFYLLKQRRDPGNERRGVVVFDHGLQSDSYIEHRHEHVAILLQALVVVGIESIPLLDEFLSLAVEMFILAKDRHGQVHGAESYGDVLFVVHNVEKGGGLVLHFKCSEALVYGGYHLVEAFSHGAEVVIVRHIHEFCHLQDVVLLLQGGILLLQVLTLELLLLELLFEQGQSVSLLTVEDEQLTCSCL